MRWRVFFLDYRRHAKAHHIHTGVPDKWIWRKNADSIFATIFSVLLWATHVPSASRGLHARSLNGPICFKI